MVSFRSLILGILLTVSSLISIVRPVSPLIRVLYVAAILLGLLECLLSVRDLSRRVLQVILGIQSVYYLGYTLYSLFAIPEMGLKILFTAVCAAMAVLAMSALHKVHNSVPAE